MESYQQWRKRAVAQAMYAGPFWAIVDANWTPAEQSELAREWKRGAA